MADQTPSTDSAEAPALVETSRRSVLGLGAVLVGGAGVGVLASQLTGLGADTTGSGAPLGSGDSGAASSGANGTDPAWARQIEPFYGTHQSGVVTAPQAHAAFLAFNLVADAGRDGLRRILRLWTSDASRLQRGIPTLADPQPDLAGPPSRLTVTVGLGRGALDKAGLLDRAPVWLAPLPAFKVDRLEDRWSEGDVFLQVCAEDPIVLAHAVRSLIVSVKGIATIHWQQRGFRRPATSASTMRNLMGQVDGTVRPAETEFDSLLWIGDEGPDWLRGGTSVVVRRIRMTMDTWDELEPEAKEQVIGRRLTSGAPLTGTKETDKTDLDATKAGLHVIPDFAHIRHAAPVAAKEKILRRPYNYDEAVTGAANAECGMLFVCFQRDVMGQFVPIQVRLAESDLLNVWTVPIGSAVFAVLPGAAEGQFLGQALVGEG